MRILPGFILFLILVPAALAQPCMKATADCTQWVGLGEPSRALVYTTYPLNKKNETIVRALIVVHGQGRDAFEFFTQEKVVVERWPKEWSRKF